MIKALPAINPEAVTNQSIESIRATLRTRNKQNVIIGLSGGVDSATTLTLVSRAVPLNQIFVLLMPGLDTSEEAMRLAELMPVRLGIPENQIIELNLAAIEQALSATIRLYTKSDLPKERSLRLLDGVRQSMLEDQARAHEAVVVASHHKTDELLHLHHAQIHLESPISNLYKTQVMALASHLGVVDDVLEKIPAPLTDESNQPLSFSEIEADPILWLLTEDNQSKQTLVDDGFDPALVDAVMAQARLA